MHGEARVKLVYFWYAGALALMVTWWPLRMQELGLGADQIGMIFSGRTAIAIITQPLFARFSDHWRRPVLLTRIVLVAALLLSLPVPWFTTFWSLALFIWLATPFEAATTPLLDTTIVRRVGAARYGGVRAWGSAGYGVATGVFAWLVADRTPGEAGYWAMFGFLLIYLLAVLSSTGLDDRDRDPSPAATTHRRVKFGVGFVTFIAFSTLHWMSIALFNYYYSLHTTALGMAPWVPGIAVAVAIVGEIFAFVFAPRLLAALSPRKALLIVPSVGVVRWLVVAFSASVAAQLSIQIVHFFSFGLWFAAAMVLLGRFTTPALRGTIQGIYASIVFAGGSTVATLLGGFAMEHLGGRAVFVAAAALELLAVVAWFVASKFWTRDEPTEP
jgi:PPP family 3-phenylpropionic acid transporter